MRRTCLFLIGSATTFSASALKLQELYYSHRKVLVDDPAGRSEAARKVESQFAEELEAFRGLYTVHSALASTKIYAKAVLKALRHFGYEDDIIARTLDATLGRQRLSSGRSALFKVDAYSSDGGKFREKSVCPLPSEIPLPPESVYSTSESLPRDVCRFHDNHRGHWVLRDPDIAITKRERREDPW